MATPDHWEERVMTTPDPLHAMQVRATSPPQVTGLPQPYSVLGVTVSVRWIPLVTAAYGT
jgi:hypothetical protein